MLKLFEIAITSSACSGEVHFQAMPHIEHLVHFAPVRIALLLDGLEQRWNGEEIVFDDTAVVSHKVQYLGLCAARAVYHTVDLGTERIEQLLNYRCVGAGGESTSFPASSGLSSTLSVSFSLPLYTSSSGTALS